MNRKPLILACLLAGVVAGTLVGGEARSERLSTSTALLSLARQAQAGDRDDRAAELYREAHQVNPFDPAPLTGLGQLAMRNGEALEAVEFFEAALALSRGDREARHGLADALLEMDRAEEARPLYERLLAEDAGDGRAWNGLGLALDLTGRHDEAQAAYRAGLALSPDNEEILANLDASRTLAAAPVETTLGSDGMTLAPNAEAGSVAVSSARPVPAGRDP